MGLMRFRLAVPLLIAFTAVIPASAGAQTLTIRLTSVTKSQVQHNIKPLNKTNKGDYVEFRDLLMNDVPQFGKAKGDPLAWDEGVIRYTSATQRIIIVTVHVPGIGTLKYQGKLSPSNPVDVVKIVGGTGGFKGAKGTLTMVPSATTSNATPNVFVVTVPGHPLNINGSGGVA